MAQIQIATPLEATYPSALDVGQKESCLMAPQWR